VPHKSSRPYRDEGKIRNGEDRSGAFVQPCGTVYHDNLGALDVRRERLLFADVLNGRPIVALRRPPAPVYNRALWIGVYDLRRVAAPVSHDAEVNGDGGFSAPSLWIDTGERERHGSVSTW